MPDKFIIKSDYEPSGDQPEAIKKIVKGFRGGRNRQTLMGVTGSGKTFTMAQVIAELNRPALVLSHNKTLAAQLYREFKDLFPDNAVEYFVSYYDYYQPEAYIPTTDSYIEKDASINEELERVRLSATRSLIERRDVIVVASVSCIYGIGSPEKFHEMGIFLEVGDRVERETLLRRLVDIQYMRNDTDFQRGAFRVRGDVVDIYRGYEDKTAIRIEMFGDEVEAISEIDPLRGTRLSSLRKVSIFPARHYVAERPDMERAMKSIKVELAERLEELRSTNHLLEAQRLEQRTRYDLEMLQEMGICSGIENYSRHIDGRNPGEPPYTLLDYFPKDWILFIDESHVTLPQVRAMYNGDRSRKSTLIEFGFRLPSALDNRPLKFQEFEEHINQVLYVSATPEEYELNQSGGIIVEQIVRPTGLIEPEVEVRPAQNQVDDLLEEIRKRAEKNERVLVTVLTKRMAEDLTAYYRDLGINVRYMHSDIDAIQRAELIRGLRSGDYDVLIGINLLREGLDLPEVSLVAVIDADKEGFLRSRVSLIQTCGRAARHIEGHVILYADTMTKSINVALEEMRRRRVSQMKYNAEHGITPRGITKEIHNLLDTIYEKDYPEIPQVAEPKWGDYVARESIPKRIAELRKEMLSAAGKLEFEKAAQLRDEMNALERQLLEVEV